LEDLELTIITGLSGAGKSVAVKSLEDLGYFCVDNLPPQLLPKMVELCQQSEKIDHLVAVIDVRGGQFFRDLFHVLEELDRGRVNYHILFLEADDATLIRRYKETRRTHPLHADGGISQSIAEERKLLLPLKERADMVIDTSLTSVRQLREIITESFRPAVKGTSPLEVQLISFGYKYGLPLDADMVFDARFLANPFWVDHLREKSGLEAEVRDFVMSDSRAEEFLNRVEGLLTSLQEGFVREGRHFITVALGCTGGRHRSVALAEELARRLRDRGWTVVVRHRDLHRD
jgi:UPF0042 nucleotide-binding protein